MMVYAIIDLDLHVRYMHTHVIGRLRLLAAQGFHLPPQGGRGLVGHVEAQCTASHQLLMLNERREHGRAIQRAIYHVHIRPTCVRSHDAQRPAAAAAAKPECDVRQQWRAKHVPRAPWQRIEA